MKLYFFLEIQLIMKQFCIMQNSRFGRAGQQSLKNRSKFTLLQQIDNDHEYKPIPNQFTSFIDETGQQVQLEQYGKESPKHQEVSISGNHYKQFEIDEVKDPSLYQLPNASSSKYKSDPQISNHRWRKKSNFEESNYSKPKRKNRTHRKAKQEPWDPNFDLPNSGLDEIEQIINEISRVMDKNGMNNLVKPSKEKKQAKKFKGFKGGWGVDPFKVSKLDEMLNNYKTTAHEEEETKDIFSSNFYESSNKKEIEQEEEEEDKSKLKEEEKFNSFVKKFEKRKNGEEEKSKISLMEVHWDQMPIIPAEWDSNLYLRLQSYPQQQQYLSVIKKAIESGVKSYSIFMDERAGIIGTGNKMKLMSEQQYAKQWENRLVNGESLSETESELLLEFDIEWYRNLVEYEYHTGLEDLLSKKYEVKKYEKLLKKIKRTSTASISLIINNQIRYIQEYFKEVYSADPLEIVLGMVRFNSDENPLYEEITQYYKDSVLAHTCILPFTDSAYVILNQIQGSTQSISINEKTEEFQISLAKPAIKLIVSVAKEEVGGQRNLILMREGEHNRWQIDFKYTGIGNTNVKVSEELLFGMLYSLTFEN